jgi:hypothetical protein
MMDGEAVREVAKLVQRETFEINGKSFSLTDLRQVDTQPIPAALRVSTLTALKDYLAADIDRLSVDVEERYPGLPEKLMLHVESPTAVELIGPIQGDWNKRIVWVRAQREELGALKFGAYLDHETFMIGLLTQFEKTEDLAEILRVIGTMKAESVNTSADDGMSQTVSARRGVALAENIKVPSPVMLRPYRTFREFNQPESPFIFRLRNTEGMPECALFDASGAAWKTTAVESIRKWLAENIKDVPVIA